MAHQSVVKLRYESVRRDANGTEVVDVYEKEVPEISNIHTGHEHCTVCGFCFTAGFTQELHRCPTAIRRDILEVMFDEMRSTSEKTRIMNRTPNGFQVSSGQGR